MKPVYASASPAPRRHPRPARGVVVVVVLLVLAVLLIGAAALVRSFNTSLATAGNLGFKRDLLNQAERAVPIVLAAVQTGGLATSAARAADIGGQNYKASVLPTNDAGIPLALLSDTAFAAVGSTTNDLTLSDQGVRVRYVIDRLCSEPGLDSVLGADKCTLASSPAPTGGSASDPVRAEDPGGGFAGALVPQVVYRLTIRVDGPRGTQGFYQTTFTM